VADHELWDEVQRPAAPPAPAGFPYTPTGRAIGAHLGEVHEHLRHELEQLRQVIAEVRGGRTSAAEAREFISELTMRQHNWAIGAYCANYCRVVTTHHSLEDAAVFPHLRRSDSGLVPVLDRLEAEHVIIHGVLEEVDRALVDVMGEQSDLLALQEVTDLLSAVLISHLDYEEAQIVEPLSRYGFFPGQL